MHNWIEAVLKDYEVKASAPCRVDMGGTLDIATFYYALQAAAPCTVNAALNLRTRVTLAPFREGWIKVSSRGFESAAFALEAAPFTHPLGLMFAIATHFGADGLHIRIDSASPPRSALGGSSVAAVALVGALARCRAIAGGEDLNRDQVVRLAHKIEENVAGVPCGVQDQLAAAYGGIHTWHWGVGAAGLSIRRVPVAGLNTPEDFEAHALVAYGGVPHESRDINGTWVRQFLAGHRRDAWVRVAACVQRFSAALDAGDWSAAVEAMNEETALRCEMTPDVLDDLGRALVAAAVSRGCGGRFTGAGGGGCLWAVGDTAAIGGLRREWGVILAQREEATLLDVGLDTSGLTVAAQPRRDGGQ